MVEDNSLLGELEHPIDRSNIDLKQAALKITELN